MNNPLSYLAGRGPHPQADTEIASPVLLDPLYYDPMKVPALVGPTDYWTGVVENFTPPVRDANVIGNVEEAGWTPAVQSETPYMAIAADNVAVNNPNIATPSPSAVAGTSIGRMTRAFEEQLILIQDFLLGAPMAK